MKTEIIISIQENKSSYSRIIPISKSILLGNKSKYIHENDEFDDSNLESKDNFSEFDNDDLSDIEVFNKPSRVRRGLKTNEIENAELGNDYLKRKHKKKKELTEDEIIRKNDLIIKRRIDQKQQKEDEKNQAIEKILNDEGRKLKEKQKKQEEKRQKDLKDKEEKQKLSLTRIKYKCNKDGVYVRFPKGILLPKVLTQKENKEYPIRKCQVNICTNDFKYKDPTSKINYCSLECFKIIRS